MNKNCIICFEFVDSVMCSCGEKTCHDCIIQFIEYCYKNGEIPKCSNCSALFKYNLIKSYDTKCIYPDIIYNYVILKNKNIIDDKINQEKMINFIRNDRLKFINSNVPLAIAKTINIALKKKVLLVEKSNLNIVKETKKNCKNLYCKGYLIKNDKVLKCTSCLIENCALCEMYYNTDHVCNNDDLLSIKLLNDTVKCPNCDAPIHRISGCDNMHCTFCKQRFNYSTLQKYSPPTVVNPVHSIVELSSDPSIMNMLVYIKSLEPVINIDKLVNLIKSVLTQSIITKSDDKIKIVEYYEKYIDDVITNKKFINMYLLLEKIKLCPYNIFQLYVTNISSVSYYHNDKEIISLKKLDNFPGIINLSFDVYIFINDSQESQENQESEYVFHRSNKIQEIAEEKFSNYSNVIVTTLASKYTHTTSSQLIVCETTFPIKQGFFSVTSDKVVPRYLLVGKVDKPAEFFKNFS